jgi:hypothetical protein
MDPVHPVEDSVDRVDASHAPLRPAVELPVRRGRPLALGAALAMLFAFGAHNYMTSLRARAIAPTERTASLTFATQPAGALVVRERDGHALCRTPCSVDMAVGRWGVSGFRFELPGYDETRVLVNLAGGDTRVEAVLEPLR